MAARKILFVSLGPSPAGLAAQLGAAGWDVVCAAGAAAARQAARRVDFMAAVLCITRVDAQIAEDVETCLKVAASAEWVGVCQPATAESAAFRELILGHFFDYHTHPADPQFLSRTLGHAYGRAVLRANNNVHEHQANAMQMVGASGLIAQLRRQIGKVALAGAPVLISGESGSGKELAAQAIHRHSARADGPFIAVNCGAITPTLIHSELFGHVRGAFTGANTDKRGLIEAANGGTIFLDEVADLPLDLQTSLLRFLQEKTICRVGTTRSIHVDVRVLSATHVDLAEAVAARRFREDLFYRLNVLTICVPALRERKMDIGLLARHFHEACMSERKKRIDGFTKQALAAMMAHDWPGNVRELYNRIQRAVVMTEQRMITAQDLGLGQDGASRRTQADGLGSARVLAERDAIHLSLNRVGQNITHAARDLGVSRTTLYRLMDKHGIGSAGK
ncbi:MAG: sigma-54 interaction domain-containing protein [Janthinobacterium lividum]